MHGLDLTSKGCRPPGGFSISAIFCLATPRRSYGIFHRRQRLHGRLLLSQVEYGIADERKPFQVAEWIFLVVACAFVVLRIYAHVFCHGKKLNWSEVLLMASAFDALGLIICDTLTFQMGVLDDYQTSERLYKVRNVWRTRSLPVSLLSRFALPYSRAILQRPSLTPAT